jgi:transmembrane sensor
MEIAAEAAVWVSRLHGPGRSAQMEQECRAWQSLSAQHRQAFERCTATWDEVQGISVADVYAATLSAAQSPKTKSASRSWQTWPWVVAAAALSLVAAWIVVHPVSYSTAVGEHRTVVLDDGSRVTLNTDSRVLVRFEKNRRQVTLQRGEGIFEVATDPHRPFVVSAAELEVVALGTQFAVSRLDDELSVTLIEGKVAVKSKEASQPQLLPVPGERIRIRNDVAMATDKPRIDQMLAWRRGEIDFDSSSLYEAVAKMNRYGRTPILLRPTGDANLRVSGVFKTGDNLAFARAIAAVHQMSVVERNGRIEIMSNAEFNRATSVSNQ